MVRLSRKLEKITLSPKQLKNMADFAGRQEDILALFLYGSYGTEWQTALSDVDLGVLPMPETSWDYRRELELLAEFCQIGRSDDINLVNLRRVPVTLQMRVLETGRLLYVKEEILLADFKERVIRHYCDFEPDLKNLYRDFDAGLREEFL
ncbi:type VII toxin-antitoxin system MntA family adenylyltransferase antitoxin [Moorella sulfitireducens]|uniref:type VII toxin-antitoxin system MntA family adenylyltransferase antitoxin n=1 Tax=Neomoorella sulfitireducens TaxID=2972948 RepID=UPI0021ACB92E|nr:nucleotidyltransferase domain-containing protein [Moorella sulfitireducens]